MDTETRKLPKLIDIKELAAYLGVSISTIYSWQQTGAGPKGFRVGKNLKWREEDVSAWIENRVNR